MKRCVIFLLLLLVSGTGSANSLPPQQLSSSAQELPQAKPLIRRPPGIYDEQLQRQQANGGAAPPLRFILSVPESDSPNSTSSNTPMPLIIALHYRGEITPFFAEDMFYDLIDPALADLNALIVLPDAQSNDWTTPTNEAALMQLLASIQATYQVDANKVLLTGYSMGGTGAWYLGQKHQERFSAVLPISGMPTPEPVNTAQKQCRPPLYVIHSQTDQVIPLATTSGYVAKLKADGCDVTLMTLEHVDHYNFPAFTDALYQAVPWIKSVWERAQ